MRGFFDRESTKNEVPGFVLSHIEIVLGYGWNFGLYTVRRQQSSCQQLISLNFWL